MERVIEMEGVLKHVSEQAVELALLKGEMPAQEQHCHS